MFKELKIFRLTGLVLFQLLVAGTALADHPSVGYGSGLGGPINTISAATLPKNRWALGLRSEYIQLKSFSNAELESFAASGEEVHSLDDLLAVFLGVGYGVTDDFTIAARIPYVLRRGIREGHLEGGVPEVHDHGDAMGVGDLTLFGQYRLLTARDWEASLVAGLKTPTGRAGVKDRDGERFETEHQPGSGSWNPMVGAAVTKRWERSSLDTSVLYTFAMEGAQKITLGDLLTYNLSASYRLNPEAGHSHESEQTAASHTHLAWDVVLELNGEWRGRDKVAGATEENSGGSLLYLSPGVRMSVGGRWSAYLSMGIPVFENVNGVQHETRLRAILGIGMAF